jgi:hypothetical protein
MPSDERGMSQSLPRVLISVAIVLCLFAPACGGDSGPDQFSSGYNTAIKRLDRANQRVVALAPARKTESSRAIARQLDRFADVLAGTRRELGRLRPPDRASKQFDQLMAALQKSVTAGRGAATAARQIEPAAQRRALRDLRNAAVEIAHAQDALARAVNSTS